jgi:DNA polymerase
MKDFLSIDIESRSVVDLRKTGVYPYAVDPTTDLWCMAYALGDGEVQLWLPGDPVPGEIEWALDHGMDFRAWNAQFERVMLACIATPRYGFPKIPLERWVDTAAEAAAMSLPRGLGKAAEVLGTYNQKDDGGHRLMLQMAKPRRARKDEAPGLYWWDDAGRIKRLCAYCQQDVETERDIAKKLRRLPESEVKVYHMDQRANDKGVLIDVELVHALKALADEAQARANRRLNEVTEGAVEAVTNVQNLRQWLSGVGVPLDDLAKQTVAETLLRDDLPPEAREALEIRQEAGKTSWKKLDSMLACLCPDDRVRGLLLYHGANTGRWSGKLVQPQNFPRPSIKNVEALIPQVLEGDYDGLEEQHPVMEIVVSLLRSCFIAADGRRFMCADFSAIEGHVTAWLAGQDSGMVTYEEMAAVIFDMAVEDVGEESMERQVGKVAVLGCGFGMGAPKYKDTVKEWTGLDISDELSVLVIDRYREKNHRIKRLWSDLQDAAYDAVKHPGRIVKCGRNGCVRYVVRANFLWCVLPSGRALAYASPRLVDRMAPWGSMVQSVEISTVDSYTRKWCRRALYGGLQTENVVQAVARDLMAGSMRSVQEAGYDVLLTVHDEVLAEVPNDNGDLESFNALMSERPDWCRNMPLEVKGWEGRRYRK